MERGDDDDDEQAEAGGHPVPAVIEEQKNNSGLEVGDAQRVLRTNIVGANRYSRAAVTGP
ncbi:hypothetical protein MMUR_03320 [Mycolicibacterium murale]|uniref:Uncharacterized protein n=1 Tax=Mycolicibacterium murale TaxID=182220 RepID=A0A7I9WFZ2_9MYCO|nr:hypothetical protein MMUR_03320 [Mycolicibacterium murale]